MTKATAETIRETAVRSLCGSPFCTYPKCACSTAPSEVDDIFSTLPITLDQLAGIANGELVLANKGDLIIPAALRGDPDKVSKAHAAWIAKGEWVLVPKEPTEAMKLAGVDASPMHLFDLFTDGVRRPAVAGRARQSLDTDECERVFKAMLAASPEKDKTT